MKKIATYFPLWLIVLLSILISLQAGRSQTFTNGNLALLVAASNAANNTTASIVEINNTSAGQSPINTYTINGTSGVNSMRFSGSASSTMYLSNSDDRTLLSFTGGNTTTSTVNINTITTRAVGTFNHSGTFSLATTYTGTSGNQTRSATTIDNSTYFIGDQGGFYSNGSSSSSPSGNIRSVKSFGGIVYAFTASATAPPVGIISAATGGTFTGLTGLANGASSRQDFYLISSGNNGIYDVLYVLDASSATVGTIFKYSLVSGSWTANGSYATTFGGFSIAAEQGGGGAFLYVSTGTGATAANSVIKLTDVAGYNTTINITTASNITLYSASGTNTIKGVAFAPICNAPSISVANVTSPICANSTLSFTCTASGTSPLTYSWSGPNSFTSSQQNPTISNAQGNASGTYTISVSNACGSNSSTTNATVNALPTPSITPTGATTFCAGNSVTLNATSASSYTWSDSETTQGITVSSSGNYSVTVTDANGCIGASSVVAVTANPTVTPSISIIANPGSTICSGSNVTFSATPTNGGSTPAYQWQLNGTNVGTNSATYSNNALTNNDQIMCVLTSNATCATPLTATSNTITINVSTSVVPSLSISTPTTSNCAGTNVTFSATPTNGGNTPSYQWLLNGTNVGSNTATYSNNSLANADVVSCVLTSSDACATPTTATSNSFTMTVIPNVTPSVTVNTSPGNVVCAGTSVTFSAASTNGGTPSYQWTKNGSTVGNSSASYIDASLVTGDAIQCVLTSNASCVTTNTVASAVITMTVNALPATPTVTGSFTFCAGNSTVLDAGSGYATYLWNTGATTQTATVNAGGTFSVTVSDGTCSSVSQPVTTTVVSAPPQPGSFTAGQAVVSVGQNGVVYTVPNDPTVNYSWGYSGTGATINGSGNSVTIDFSSSATSGTVSVTASNICGISSAQTMAVSVNPASFTTGNLVALTTSGTASKASSQITLKEFSTSGAPAASIAIPTTGSYPLQTAGMYGGSEGFLTRSADGRYLVLAGYATSSTFTDITATSASSVARAVGTVGQSGAYTQVGISNTFYNQNDIRGAVSDGTNFWTSGASGASFDGIDYFGPGTPDGLGTGTTPPKAYGLRIFNGQIYYSTQKAGPSNTTSQLGIFSLSGGMPTASPVTVAQVINTGTLTPEDFSFNPTSDVCYICINQNNASGGIQKWTKSGSTWSLAYTLGTGVSNIGAYGIEVDYSGVNAVIYATTYEATGNRIIKVTDTGAGSAATNIVAATSGVFYKGITFAPIASGIPVVNLSVSSNAGSEAAQSAIVVTASASSPVIGTQTISLNVSGTNITSGDYTLSNSVITIPGGATTGTATFSIVDDLLNEGTEVASLTLNNPSTGIVLGGIVTQTVSIIDNDGNNPPTISMNVVSTTNYIDNGFTTSPASPYSVSGTQSDPTDPAATLGIDFLVNDIETSAATLTVTAVSTNTAVVPSAGLQVSGTGSIRNVKIASTAIGYSDIVVSVNDGVATATYTIAFASSDPSPTINASNTFWHTGMSDGSDGVAIDNNYYMSGDDELDVVNVYARNASGLPTLSFNFAGYCNLPDPGHPEVDTEAGTKSPKISNRSYWLGSMSNGKGPTYDNKPNRDRLVATTHSGTGQGVSISFSGYCAIRSALISWGDAHGYNFTASAAAGVDSKGLDGFSAEGMVFGPDSTTLWVALRAPLVPTSYRHKAVIAPILNFEAWFNNGNQTGSPTFGAPIELDLNMNGFRDIIRLSNGTYVIVAGSPLDNGGTSAIYKWTGNPSDAPIPVPTAADGILNMEGAMEVQTGGTIDLTKLQVISDYGANVLYNDGNEAKDFGDLNLRKYRSDVLTGIDLNICTGFGASITASGSTTICTGDSVTLTASSNMSSYAWSNSNTTQSITVKNSGTYSVSVTNGSGCTATATKTVTVNTLPNVQAIATPTAVCSGHTLSLTASGASTYTWSSGVNNGVAFTPTTTATYTVSGTNSSGCKNTATINVAVNPTPTVTANSSTVAVCAGQQVTLTGGGATSYAWSSSVIDGIAFTPTSTATYTVTGSNGTCIATATTNVTVNQLPAAPTVTANGNVLTSSPASTYQWYYNGNVINGGTSQTYTAMQNGTYAVSITDINGCTAMSGTVSVNSTAVSGALVSSEPIVKPNPFANSFTVNLYTTGNVVSFEIYNSIGEKIDPQISGGINNGQGQFTITLQEVVPAGFYYLRMRDGLLVKTVKLSKL